MLREITLPPMIEAWSKDHMLTQVDGCDTAMFKWVCSTAKAVLSPPAGYEVDPNNSVFVACEDEPSS